MRKRIFYIALIFPSFLFSQKITVIRGGVDDSSYYDVCKVSENEFWAIGKKGIITTFNADGNAENISYPNKGADLLNMTLLDDENYLLCGDKGYVYHYNKTSWNVRQVKGYENSCFYSICAVDKNTAFISGGRSAIASSRRVIPFGFILKTEDGGKTWKEVFHSVTNMVWSVKCDSGKIYALIYTPVKTRLLSSSDSGNSWNEEEKKIKGLYHDFKIHDGKLFLAGGKNGHFRKNGIVKYGDKIFKYKKTGIFWDIEMNEKYAIASSAAGNILVINSGEWKFLKTPVNNNLYEIVFADENTAFIVGNSKTILRVDFSE